MFGMTIPPGGFLARQSRTEYVIGKSRMVPIGLDSDGAGSLLSTAWTFAYAAEATEIPFKLLTKLDGAMRWTKTESHPQLPERSQIIADANPADPEHPLNLRAEDCPDSLRKVETKADYDRLQEYNCRRAADPVKRWKRIVTKIQDNPRFWDRGKWCLTPGGEIYMKERMGGYTGYMKARWVDGLWKAPSGVVFPEYDPDVHDCEDFEPPHEWPIVEGCDPGYGTTAWEWAALSPDGGIYFFDEIYEGGKAFTVHCEEAKLRNEKNGRNIVRSFGDPNEAFSNTSQGFSCSSQAAKLGIRMVPWPADKGADFVAGVENFRNFLLGSKVVAPHYIRICKRCRGLRSNLSSWSFAKNRSGEVPEGAERFEKGNDHGIDVCRGILQSGFLQKLHILQTQEGFGE